MAGPKKVGKTIITGGKITIGLENIFDVHYRSFASGVSAPGRNLRLGLNLKF